MVYAGAGVVLVDSIATLPCLHGAVVQISFANSVWLVGHPPRFKKVSRPRWVVFARLGLILGECFRLQYMLAYLVRQDSLQR